MGVPEGEERKHRAKNFFKEILVDTSQIQGGNQTSSVVIAEERNTRRGGGGGYNGDKQ